MLKLFTFVTTLYAQSKFFHTNFIFKYVSFFIQILILKNYSAFIFNALNNYLIYIHIFLILFHLLKNSFII